MHQIGIIETERGSLESAAVKFNTCLEFMQKKKLKDNLDVAMILNDLVFVLMELGKFEEALSRQKRSLKIVEKVRGL